MWESDLKSDSLISFRLHLVKSSYFLNDDKLCRFLSKNIKKTNANEFST